MAATNIQVQQYVNERVRVRAEQLRAVYLAMQDDKAAIDDVYANLSGTPDWTDNRTDGPPALLEPSDVLAYNAFLTAAIAFFEGDSNWPVVRAACVRALPNS